MKAEAVHFIERVRACESIDQIEQVLNDATPCTAFGYWKESERLFLTAEAQKRREELADAPAGALR